MLYNISYPAYIHVYKMCEYLRITPGKLPTRILSGPLWRTQWLCSVVRYFSPTTGLKKDQNIKPEVLYTLSPCVHSRRLLSGHGLNELTSPLENIIYRIDSSSRRSLTGTLSYYNHRDQMCLSFYFFMQ